MTADPTANQPSDAERTAWDAIVADLSADLNLAAIIADEQMAPATPGNPVAPQHAHDETDALPADEDDDDDGPEAFIPPEPPPIPPPSDVIARFAWAAVLGGPVLFLVASVLSLGRTITGIAAVLAIAGFATLIARKKERSPDEQWGDDHYGDGAIR